LIRLPLRMAGRMPAALFLLSSAVSFGQTAAIPAQVSFQFERQGLAVPKFTFTVDATGSANYEAEEITAARGDMEGVPQPAQHIVRTVTLTKATTERIFSTAQELDRFNVVCASKMKNIADTGTKTLRYTGEGGDGSCTYNYSENKRVTQLTDLFLAIAVTLDAGRRLDFQHRFDRLGLDATMASLAEEVDSGRAAEVGTIAPTLRSLAGDLAVLQRVRERAARLLQTTQPPS
jgi:hypothetical protein